jgi:hypothetical protein
MRRALFLLPVLVLVGLNASPSPAGGPKKQKVRLIVHSWLLPGTLATSLKSGKGITDVEVQPSKGKKVNLSEVIKGSDEKPPTGEYELHRIQVTKGKTYNTHDAYLNASLPKGTKLTNFVYKGTFTGTVGGEKHKYTFFEATATTP